MFIKLHKMLAIKPGTLIIIPHQPEPGRCVSAIATRQGESSSPYDFIEPLETSWAKTDFRNCIAIDPTTVQFFTREMARKLPAVDRAIWGKGGYAAPVNLVRDEEVAAALIDFVGISPTLSGESEGTSFSSWREGKRREFYGTRIERNPQLRAAALKIHGLDCQVCGFNFSQRYGKHGEGFIHVHHLKPLSSTTGVRDVDPQTDLRVLCVNCHCMIHRKRDKTLTLEELSAILRKPES